ncbi:MAG: homocysteine S-methyltransferase [Gammaproteobacteria bacterium]|nr:homocysteine S-methyltransferase [Gammaproteobacteria bacterium]
MDHSPRIVPALLQPYLKHQTDTMVIDGALATELENRGANIDDPLWSAKILLEAPATIRQLHYDYFVAGADVAISASYQASFEGFAARGLDQKQSAALLRLSVELARQARDEFLEQAEADAVRHPPLVAASVGPYGAHLQNGSEYHGDYSVSDRQLMDFHLRRIEVLLQPGPDLLALETIPSLREGELLLRALEEFPQALAWLSFSCRDGALLSHGERFASAMMAAADSAQILAAGVNCTPPQFVSDLLRSVPGGTGKPLLAYPNSGECWVAGANSWLPGQAGDSLAVMAAQWRSLGARIIGGCCRTGVADITELSRSLRT